MLWFPAASFAEAVMAFKPSLRLDTLALHVVDVGYETAPMVAVEDVIMIAAVSVDLVPVIVCED